MTDDALQKPLCDEKCSKIERNGIKFIHIELCNAVAASVMFSNRLTSRKVTTGDFTKWRGLNRED